MSKFLWYYLLQLAIVIFLNVPNIFSWWNLKMTCRTIFQNNNALRIENWTSAIVENWKNIVIVKAMKIVQGQHLIIKQVYCNNIFMQEFKCTTYARVWEDELCSNKREGRWNENSDKRIKFTTQISVMYIPIIHSLFPCSHLVLKWRFQSFTNIECHSYYRGSLGLLYKSLVSQKCVIWLRLSLSSVMLRS